MQAANRSILIGISVLSQSYKTAAHIVSCENHVVNRKLCQMNFALRKIKQLFQKYCTNCQCFLQC